MEAILRENDNHLPQSDVLAALSDKFSQSVERAGKVPVQTKQVWNWFQNRRFALREMVDMHTGKLAVTSGPTVDPARHVTQSVQVQPALAGTMFMLVLSHRHLETEDPEVLVRFSGFGPKEYEWINIHRHVRQRSLPCESTECVAVLLGDLILCSKVMKIPHSTGGFITGWIYAPKPMWIERKLGKDIDPSAYPECWVVLFIRLFPSLTFSCQGIFQLHEKFYDVLRADYSTRKKVFYPPCNEIQEDRGWAVYFDAHVVDAQRRRHDIRGCHCRFLVHYDHDQSEEIVPLKKVLRRPETDCRLHQLRSTSNNITPATNQPLVKVHCFEGC